MATSVFWILLKVDNKEEKLFESKRVITTGCEVASRDGGVVTVDNTKVFARDELLTETDTKFPDLPHVVIAPFKEQVNPLLKTTGDGIETWNVPEGLPEGIVKDTVRVAVALLTVEDKAN
jgi:hypothetical protein